MFTEPLDFSKSSKLERINFARYTTDPKTLAVLASDLNDNVRMEVAANPNISKDILITLAEDNSNEVRAETAANAKTPVDVLTVLASDSDKHVRWRVAQNPNTPVDVLTVLATNLDEYVRWRVAYNENTPSETLIVLASDVKDEVRWHVAGNSAASSDLLWCLLTDNDKPTVNRAATRLRDQNLSLTDSTWANSETLKTIYGVLQRNNVLNASMLTQLLKAKIVLTQLELIELCELYDGNIRELIKNNYTVTHPLLEQILASKHTHTTSVIKGR